MCSNKIVRLFACIMEDTNPKNNQNNLGLSLLQVGVFTLFGSIFVSIPVLSEICFGFSFLLIAVALIFILRGKGTFSDSVTKSTPMMVSSANISGAPPSRIQPNNFFNGVWNSDWGEISLKQDGIDVVGKFIGADLNGQVTGRKFFFDWQKLDENLSGRGVLTIENGLLTGSWGHGESRDNGGPINGTPLETAASLVVNPPAVIEEKVDSVETKVTTELNEETNKIDKIKQRAHEKKVEMSDQIKDKVEELEEKIPLEIKSNDKFKEMKSTIEDTVVNLDVKADKAIEEVAAESTDKLEEFQDKIMLSMEDSLSKLNETLERLDKAVMTKDRETIISELSGSEMNLNLTVDRIDNTIGYGIDEALRGGKTIIGNVEGVPHAISIKVPKSMNDFASGLKKGQKIDQNVTLSSFNSIRKMLEFSIKN
tara:strand:- start:6969 stop:8243 length:1275 start_codon:yes stop_codon:yes gene_type:complete